MPRASDKEVSETQAMQAALEELGLDAPTLSLAWEARAKLTWGDRPHDVEADLLAAGVAHQTSRMIVQTCLKERGRALRAKGLRDTALGGVLLPGAVLAAVAVVVLCNHLAQFMRIPLQLPAVLWAGCVLLGLAGGYLLIRGLERLVFGAYAEGPVSDIDEFG